MQEVEFPIEIIIHDDASTDKTAEIIREYEKEFSNLIVAIYQTENQWSKGIRPSPKFVWPKARGKYIALCEGDDYWTDPYKLQKQVDFLEQNLDFSICFHKVKILKKGILFDDYITEIPGEVSTIEDLAHRNYIHTPSVIFRNGLIKEYPKWYLESPIGDHPLHLLNAQYGNIKFINQYMAVYRTHKGGIWSQKKWDDLSVLNKLIITQDAMFNYFSGNVKKILAAQLSISYLNLAEIYFNNNQNELSVYAFNKSISLTSKELYKRYFKYIFWGRKLKRIVEKFIRLFPKIKKNIYGIVSLVFKDNT